MKKLFRFIGTVFAVFIGALIGNVIGDQIRSQVTQTPSKVKVSHYDEETKETTIAIQPLLTNVIPAWLAGALCKPHWLWALLVGGLAGGLLSDRFEQQLKEMMNQIEQPTDQPVEE